MNTKHGTLNGNTLLFDSTQIDLPGSCMTALEALADTALDYRLTHMWVLSPHNPFEKASSHGQYSFQTSERHGKMQTVSVWKRGTGHSDIIFPSASSWYGTENEPTWIQRANSQELLVTISYLERALHVPITGSPGSAGWSLLKMVHPEWVEDIPGVNLREMHFVPGSGRDIIWQRELALAELKKHYLHKFDKRSAYPSAATQTDVGVGTPVYVDHGKDARHEKGHPQAVGVWLCHVSGKLTYPDMPPKQIPEGDYWLSGPYIRMLQAAGYTVQAQAGYVFPERHDVLVKWGNLLWKVRQNFSDTSLWPNLHCAAFASEASKRIPNAMIGLTAFKGYEDDQEEKRRPDIRLQVVSRNAEIMFHNINKIRMVHGVTPVLVYMDAIYYLSDNPDGREAFPEIVKRETQLGGFKYEGYIDLSESFSYSNETTHFTGILRDLLSTKMNVARKLEVFNAKGWSE